MKSNKGQVLILSIILIPLLWLALGLLIRSGKTTGTHGRIQNFIDHKALEALSKQAQALETLGKLNYYAQSVIDSRRTVDALLATPFLNTAFIAQLIRARAILVKKQSEIYWTQENIKNIGMRASQKEIKSPLPTDLQGNITNHHDLPNSYFISKKDNYRKELGAPLQLNSDFREKQTIKITADVKTENFLQSWFNFKKTLNMKLFSAAEIKMNSLEERWEVKLLKEVAGRP